MGSEEEGAEGEDMRGCLDLKGGRKRHSSLDSQAQLMSNGEPSFGVRSYMSRLLLEEDSG